jgi:hypothetical protein
MMVLLECASCLLMMPDVLAGTDTVPTAFTAAAAAAATA